METMNKRLVLVEPHKFDIKEEAIPETPENGFVIKTAYVGICRSDVLPYLKGYVPLPRVMGHEISGTVHGIGPSISKDVELRQGDRVVVYPWGTCNKCDVCLKDITYCRNMSLPTGYNKLESFQYGFWKDGGYQQYVVVHDASFVIKVPDAIPLDIACMVPCSGITAYHAVTKLKQSVDEALTIRDHARVAVIGVGGLGLWAIPIIKAMYPQNVKITAVDIVKEKLDDAKSQGADDVFLWAKDDTVDAVVGQYIQIFGDTEFIDGAIDFTGMAPVQMKTFGILNVGGTLAIVGLSGTNVASFPLMGLAFKCVMVKGVYVGTRAHTDKVFELILENKIKPPPIRFVDLNQVEDILIALSENEMRGRAVVKML